MLNPDYRDILLVFTEEHVEYLLVGAYAMAAHGYPRATGDIDLWIRPHLQNAECVMKALLRFGAPLHDITSQDFTLPDTVFQIGNVPRRIDILTAIDGVEFEQAWQECQKIEVEGIPVNLISRFHLKQNKSASGRPKDQADLAWLNQAPEE